MNTFYPALPLRYALFALALALGSGFTAAQSNKTRVPVAAHIKTVVGQAFVNGKAVQPGAALAAGNAISTGADSWAVVDFADGQQVGVAQNSALVVERFNYQPNKPQASNVWLNLLQGGMRFISGQAAKANPMGTKITTPVAIIGVRGTDFATAAISGQNSITQVYEGAISAHPSAAAAAGYPAAQAAAGQSVQITPQGETLVGHNGVFATSAPMQALLAQLSSPALSAALGAATPTAPAGGAGEAQNPSAGAGGAAGAGAAAGGAASAAAAAGGAGAAVSTSAMTLGALAAGALAVAAGKSDAAASHGTLTGAISSP